VQIPTPAWTPGSGANQAPGLSRWAADAKVKEIIPSEQPAGGLYKMLISVSPAHRFPGFLTSSWKGVVRSGPAEQAAAGEIGAAFLPTCGGKRSDGSCEPAPGQLPRSTVHES